MSALNVNADELFVAETDGDEMDLGFWGRSIYPTAIVVSLYLLFVLKLGPAYMKNREPFELKKTLIYYNLFLIVYNIWLLGIMTFSPHIHQNIVKFVCGTPVNLMLRKIFYRGLYWYYVSKLIELLDTVFFVLRKKNNQISFLHVYHHSFMALGVFAYLKYITGPQGCVFGILNTSVHIIMYTYYLIAALGPQYQKYLWWKKYMTTIQIGQFVIMIVFILGTNLAGCTVARSVNYFLAGHAVIFLYLFMKFYLKSYKKTDKPPSSEKNTENLKAH